MELDGTKGSQAVMALHVNPTRGKTQEMLPVAWQHKSCVLQPSSFKLSRSLAIVAYNMIPDSLDPLTHYP